MKHLGISGGGTKIGGLYGAASVLMREKNYLPDVISGISAGAILSVPLAMGLFDELEKLLLHFSLKDFFSLPPIKDNGKIRTANAIVRILNGDPYLGEQNNLEKTLGALITKEKFKAYQSNDKYPACVIGSVDFYTASRLYVNLKEVEYPLFLKLVNASASIPVFTSGIQLDESVTDFEGNKTHGKMWLFDGGVRDHIGTARVLNSNVFPISETVSIFSRPEDYRLKPNTFHGRNLLEVLNRYVEINNIEISKEDEFDAGVIAKQKGIKAWPNIYLPGIMEDVYDVDPVRLREIMEAGKKEGRKWNSTPVVPEA